MLLACVFFPLSSGFDADIPTAPEWAMILLGALLMLQLARRQQGTRRGGTAGTLRCGPEAALIGALLLLTHSARADEALQYDERGNLKGRNVDGRASSYQYDVLDRLRREAGAANQSFGLDENGNRTSDGQAGYTVHAKGNRLVTRNGVTLIAWVQKLMESDPRALGASRAVPSSPARFIRRQGTCASCHCSNRW